ncbi:MAG: DUF423 domain-containing protein [Planctomycetes bacterium]|nr:DUF423 domain-containing protein [Planctomycetota bacterium]
MQGSRPWVVVGAVLAGLAVGLLAFAVEGLDDYFARKYEKLDVQIAGVTVARSTLHLEQFQTAALFQLIHGLALVAVGLVAHPRAKTWSRLAGWAFVLGIVLYSGGRYAQTLADHNWLLQMTVPFGAALLVLGWLGLALAGLQKPAATTAP